MRSVFASAVAEIVLIMARSAIVIVGASGTHVGTMVTTIIGFLQGIAAAIGIGALAVGPVVTATSALCRSWLAYQRLQPLWEAVKESVPDGSGAGIRQRLQRRVTEIQAAEQALSPYWREDVAARAQAVAQSATLGPDLEQAFIEATVVLDAASARRRGDPPATELLAADRTDTSTSNDPDAEVARLVLVSQAVRQNQRRP